MAKRKNIRENEDVHIHIRMSSTLADSLKTDMAAEGYRELSPYIRAVLERRGAPARREAHISRAAVTAIDHLASEVRKIGVLYNQFVAAYNRALTIKGQDGLPRVTAKETQRNQLALMELTMDMTRKIHAVMDKIGIPHENVAIRRTEEEKAKENLSQGKVVIPKFK